MPTPGPAPRGPGRVDRARGPRGQGGGRRLGREGGSAGVRGDQALRPLQPLPRLTRMAPGRRRPRPRLRCWGAAEGRRRARPGSEATTWADPEPERASTAGGLRREPAEVSSRVGAPRALQPPRGKGARGGGGGGRGWGGSSSVFSAPAAAGGQASSLARAGLAFLQHFLGSRKAASWAPRSPSHPLETFSEVGLAAAAGCTQAAERCKLPPGPTQGWQWGGVGWEGGRRSECALAWGALGSARCAPAEPWAGRGRQVDAGRVCGSVR